MRQQCERGSAAAECQDSLDWEEQRSELIDGLLSASSPSQLAMQEAVNVLLYMAQDDSSASGSGADSPQVRLLLSGSRLCDGLSFQRPVAVLCNSMLFFALARCKCIVPVLCSPVAEPCSNVCCVILLLPMFDMLKPTVLRFTYSRMSSTSLLMLSTSQVHTSATALHYCGCRVCACPFSTSGVSMTKHSPQCAGM